MRIKKATIIAIGLAGCGVAAREAGRAIKAFDTSLCFSDYDKANLPELPHKQTYTPKVNRKTKRY